MARPVLPSWGAPIAEKDTGIVSTVWRLFLQQLVSPAKAIASVTVSASPFAYTASDDGQIVIEGGTVSGITLKRGNTTITLPGTSGMFAISQGDIVTTTYAVAPTISFVPR